jgi:Pyruvate/2-oxoacid:ferredoxin oxidoreductase gamma subunit
MSRAGEAARSAGATTDVLLAGVGGQGVLLASETLALAALAEWSATCASVRGSTRR